MLRCKARVDDYNFGNMEFHTTIQKQIING